MKLIERIFSWEPNDPAIQPFVWLKPGDFMGDPSDAARQTANAMGRLEPQKRCLFIGHALGTRETAGWLRKGIERDISRGLDDLNARIWYRRYFEKLQSLRADPYFVCLDDEDGYSMWWFDAQKWDRFMMNPAFRDAIPPDLRVAGQEFFAGNWFVPGAKIPVAWNEFAAKRNFEFLDKLIYAQLRDIWPEVRYGNYEQSRFGFPVVDINGHPVPSVPARFSMPVAYLWIGQEHRRHQKHPLWSSLISSLNYVRSSVLGGPTWVWLAAPGYTGDVSAYPDALGSVYWQILMRHLVSTGIDGGIYFHPQISPHKHVDLAKKTFAEATLLPRPDGLAPIPWDADSIKTGDVTTNYEEVKQFEG